MRTQFRFIAIFVLSTILAFTYQQSAKAQEVVPDLSNASIVSLGEQPWTASLKTATTMCTGTLVAAEWILTDAHCVPEDFATISIGGVNRNFTEPGEILTHAIEVVRYPAYKSHPYYYDYDIALVKIPWVKKTDNIKVLGLYTDTLDPTGQMTVTLVGWGKIETGEFNSQLREATIHYICSNVGSHIICSSDTDPGVGLCPGDSGGPAIIEVNEVPLLIASAVAADKCNDPSRQSLFLRITPNIDWIMSVINKPDLFIPVIHRAKN